jgi:ABC-2 type transport system permease protein
LRLYGAFWRNSFRQAVEFRANFWANLFVNMGWMFSLVVFIEIIYRNTTLVANWTKPEMLVLFGTYSMLRGISNTLFYSNLSQLPTYIRMGTMDFILTKPVNAMFYTTLRYVSFDDLGQSLGASVVIAYGWTLLAHAHGAAHVGLAEALGFAGMMACGLVLFYSINLILMTTAFWLVRLDNLMVLADTMFSIARTPIEIFRRFGPAAPFVFTYLIPLAFLASIPVKELFGRVALLPAMTASLCLSVCFLVVSALFWRYATRSYASASS